MSYPFTPQGVADQITALYSLSDGALALEANAIKKDFADWVINHFTLTVAQKAYLNALPARSTASFGNECSTCFLYRLPITFVYPAPPQPSGYGKLVESTSSTKLTTGDNGETTATGELTFTIVYKFL